MIHYVWAMDDEWSDLELMAGRLHERVPWTREQRLARPRINPIRIATAWDILVKGCSYVDRGPVKIVFDEQTQHWTILVTGVRITSVLRFLVAHEIGEWYMKRTGYQHWNIEYLCDAFAFVLLMPAELLRPRLGGDPWAELPRIAETFDVPVYSVAIRLALLFGVPTAVINKGEVLRVHDWGVSASDEWLRVAESDSSVRVVEHGKLKVVVKR